jgi:hypothetical protein
MSQMDYAKDIFGNRAVLFSDLKNGDVFGRTTDDGERPYVKVGKRTAVLQDKYHGKDTKKYDIWRVALDEYVERKGRIAESTMLTMAAVFHRLEESELAAASKFMRGDMGLHIIKYPSGRFGFVGKVPVELGYARKDGKPFDAESRKKLKDDLSFGMPVIGKEKSAFVSLSWATAKDALKAARKAGFEVEQDADYPQD